jgi:hypothetical protein
MFLQAIVKAPMGAGLAVSHTLSLLVVPSDHKVTVHRLAPGLPVVGTLGTEGDGPEQFLQPRGVCFPPWERHTLLVAEYGNNRVQEVEAQSGAHVRFWGGALVHPVGVAASAAIVVVTEWGKANRVSAFDKATGVLRWRSDLLPGCPRFKNPYGVRVAQDGYVVVADNGNNRVSRLRGADGVFAGHLATEAEGVKGPRDVEELLEPGPAEGGGFVVACDAPTPLMVVFRPGEPCRVLAADGPEPGQFSQVTGLAALRWGSLVVRERGNGGRLQVVPMPASVPVPVLGPLGTSSPDADA